MPRFPFKEQLVSLLLHTKVTVQWSVEGCFLKKDGGSDRLFPSPISHNKVMRGCSLTTVDAPAR